MHERTRRFAALGLGYLVILAWMIVLGLLGPLGSEALYFLLLTLVVGIYLYKPESGGHHATWGKRKMVLRASGRRGAIPKKAQILLRAIVKLAHWELAHFFVWQMKYVFYRAGWGAASAAALIYVVMEFVTGRGPRVMAAGTVVLPRVPGVG